MYPASLIGKRQLLLTTLQQYSNAETYIYEISKHEPEMCIIQCAEIDKMIPDDLCTKS